jgi:uncharacterized membrane protein YuzA (DUF378 family)
LGSNYNFLIFFVKYTNCLVSIYARSGFIMKMNSLMWVAMILVVVGALNWGLVGLFGFNLVTAIFGSMGFVVKLIYILVGASGVWALISIFKGKK